MSAATGWPVDSAFEEVDTSAPVKSLAPVSATASTGRSGRLSLTLSINGDVCRELGADVGDRFRLYSTQTRSGVYIRLVRDDRGHCQLTATPNSKNQSDPRTMFRIGSTDLPVKRGKRLSPDFRVVEVGGAKALEVRLEAIPPAPAPSAGEQAAIALAKKLRTAGHTADEVIQHLDREQNFRADAAWLEKHGVRP